MRAKKRKKRVKSKTKEADLMKKQYNTEETYDTAVNSLDVKPSLPGFKSWLCDLGVL